MMKCHHFHPYYSPTPLKYRNIEDINTAHAILDLSKTSTQYPTASTPADIKPMISNLSASSASQNTPSPLLSPALSTATNSTESSVAAGSFSMNNGKTTQQP